MTDIHLLTDDLPTEEEINEWTRTSRKEGICGIVNCLNNLPKNVKNAKTTIARNISRRHLDLLLDSTFEYSSSNIGLDWYTD